MAAGLGFKEFSTGDVLTAGDVNGYLMQGVLVFADATARDAAITSPQEGQAAYLKSTDKISTYSGSAWVEVGGGGGGKVLQVVNATHSTSVNNATNTFADTGLTATITPSLATSKVLVLVNQAGLRKTADNVDNGVLVNLLRASTQLVADFAGLAAYTATALNNYVGSASISYLDSPNTTSATTYKTQFKNFVNANAVSVQVGPSTSSITLLEIGA